MARARARPRSAASTARGRMPMRAAGTPPTIEYGSVSRVTTAPALTTVPSAMVTPGRITALAPIQTSLPMSTKSALWPWKTISTRGSSKRCCELTITTFGPIIT